MTAQPDEPPVAGERFRRVLGRYPTGVCVVTATEQDGTPVGLTVGTFTSVSLDPPLVAFLPAKTSTSWPRIEPAGRFCINILGYDQEELCRRFSGKASDKFAGVNWSESRPGSFILDGAVAWIDCDLQSVQEAGDHFIVIARVAQLDVARDAIPLLFFQGGYGRFAPGSLVSGEVGLGSELRLVDFARPEMERVATTCGTRCVAAALVRDEIVLMGTAGDATSPASDFIGERTPLRPAGGTVFMAYAPPAVVDRWLSEVEPPEDRETWRVRLEQVRRRGYSVGIRSSAHIEYERLLAAGDVWGPDGRPTADALRLIAALVYDPRDFSLERAGEVRSLHAPVFGPTGEAVMALSIFLPAARAEDAVTLDSHARSLVEAANRVAALSGGRVPS